MARVLVSFGDDDVSGSALNAPENRVAQDSAGNYWNCIERPNDTSTQVALVDDANQSTGLSLQLMGAVSGSVAKTATVGETIQGYEQYAVYRSYYANTATAVRILGIVDISNIKCLGYTDTAGRDTTFTHNGNSLVHDSDGSESADECGPPVEFTSISAAPRDIDFGPDQGLYGYFSLIEITTSTATGPTIDSAPSTLVRTTEGATIDVTSGDTIGHTVDLENSAGDTTESQTVNSITDNGDGTVTIDFDVVPGALTVGATDHVLRVTDSNGNDTQTGITLRHPRVYVQAEADDGSNLSAGASWWARESEGQAPVDSGSVNFDGNGVGLLTFANTSVAPGGSLIVDSKYNQDARRAISELTIE